MANYCSNIVKIIGQKNDVLRALEKMKSTEVETLRQSGVSHSIAVKLLDGGISPRIVDAIMINYFSTKNLPIAISPHVERKISHILSESLSSTEWEFIEAMAALSQVDSEFNIFSAFLDLHGRKKDETEENVENRIRSAAERAREQNEAAADAFMAEARPAIEREFSLNSAFPAPEAMKFIGYSDLEARWRTVNWGTRLDTEPGDVCISEVTPIPGSSDLYQAEAMFSTIWDAPCEAFLNGVKYGYIKDVVVVGGFVSQESDIWGNFIAGLGTDDAICRENDAVESAENMGFLERDEDDGYDNIFSYDMARSLADAITEENIEKIEIRLLGSRGPKL